MKELEERIARDGVVREGNVLKTDSFLNHQLDITLLDHIGAEFYRLYKDSGITKIVTIEASGIAIASMTARYFGVPVVFAKKAKSRNLDGNLYTTTVHSFTYNKDYTVTLSQKFLGKEDKVLIIDDFLADGKALCGLLDIAQQSGCTVAGVGICVEKGFQPGGIRIRSTGVRIESLAIIESMNPATGEIVFREQ